MSFDPSVPARLTLSEADLALIREWMPHFGQFGFRESRLDLLTKSAAIFRSHFPESAPLAWAVWQITDSIAEAIDSRDVPIRVGDAIIDPLSREFGTALNTIRDLGPKIIANNSAVSSQFPDHKDYALKLNEAVGSLLERLEVILGLAGEWPRKPPRKQDIRSRWHPTARYFRTVINLSFQYGGAENKVANSGEDKTILAISELLTLLPAVRTATPDTVRAALFMKNVSAKDFP